MIRTSKVLTDYSAERQTFTAPPNGEVTHPTVKTANGAKPAWKQRDVTLLHAEEPGPACGGKPRSEKGADYTAMHGVGPFSPHSNCKADCCGRWRPGKFPRVGAIGYVCARRRAHSD